MLRTLLPCLSLLLSTPALAKFALEHDEGDLKLSARVLAGYTKRFLEEDDGDYSHDRFHMKQVRLGIKGTLYDDYIYSLNFDFATTPKAKSNWLGWHPSDLIELKLGQFKVPLSAHRLESGRRLLFIDRPAVSDEFIPSRDIGAQLTSKLSEGRYVIKLGAFNHRGANVKEEDDKGTPLVVGRLEWAPRGPIKGGEGGVGPRRFVAQLGLSAAWSDDGEPAFEDPLHSINGAKALYNVDVALKGGGVFFYAEFNSAQYTPDEGQAYAAAGYQIMLSYYIRALKLEPAVRYDDLNPSDAVAGDRQSTVTGGLNFYPKGSHAVKLMLNYSHHLDDGEGPWHDDELMLLGALALD